VPSTENPPPAASELSSAGEEELLVAALTPHHAQQVLELLRGFGVGVAIFQALRSNGTVRKLNLGLQEKLSPYLNTMELEKGRP